MRVLTEPSHPLGIRARKELAQATRLSPANVEYALTHCLEVTATEQELTQLIEQIPRSPRAHVLLSANVFTASLRAVAIAIASSPKREIRASRRDTLFTELLHEASPETFDLTEQLSPEPGEHVWAYGSDSTMQTLLQSWPAGVVLHAHGYGYGVIAITFDAQSTVTDEDFDKIALDVAVFDQRGCLSPRVVLVQGDEPTTLALAQRLFAALKRVDQRFPVGSLSDQELTENAHYRALWQYLGTCYESDAGRVSVDLDEGPWTVAPGGRSLHVRKVTNLSSTLVEHATEITTLGCQLEHQISLATLLPTARVVGFGRMQRPPLDGPVDRRTDPAGIILGSVRKH
jgi:hypothetical protein